MPSTVSASKISKESKDVLNKKISELKEKRNEIQKGIDGYDARKAPLVSELNDINNTIQKIGEDVAEP